MYVALETPVFIGADRTHAYLGESEEADWFPVKLTDLPALIAALQALQPKESEQP